MDTTSILRLEIWGFLCLLAAIVTSRLLTGKINLRGLLSRKDDTGATSPERVQLLIATFVVAGKFLGNVFHSQNGRMPDIDVGWLYTLGGSSGIYAVGKAVNTLRSRAKNFGVTR